MTAMTMMSSCAPATSPQSPFIYSALSARKKKQRPEVLWVQGDPAEIAMVITNPLPVELRVEKMVREGWRGPVYICYHAVKFCKDYKPHTIPATL